MKKLTFLISISILISCSAQEKYWIDNWAYLDEGLNKYFPYTEIYFDDTAYVLQNKIFGIGMEKYKVSNDSLYRIGFDENVLLGRMERLNDSIIQIKSPDKDFKFYKISEGGDFKPFGNDDEEKDKAFFGRFDKRAENFYLKIGMFKSRADYKKYQEDLELNLPDGEFEKIIEIEDIK